MSKLEELIAELCSDGVEYVSFGDICSIITKQTGFDYTNHIKDSLIREKITDCLPYIQTKFFAGKNFNFETDYFVPYHIVEKFPKITLDSRCILLSIVGASIGNIGLFPGDRKCFLGGAICVAKPHESYNVDYLFYYLTSRDGQKQIFSKVKGAGQATVTIEDIRKFQIPVPPPPVQSEIVRILDNFTGLTEELTEELTAEFTARTKQYKYYKDKLFTGAKDIQMVTLDMISENCDAQRRPVTSGNRETGNVPYYGASGIVDYVKDYIFDGDYLLISEDGANLLARTTPIAFSISGKTWVNNHAHVLKFEEYATRRFVEMYLNSIDLSYYITGAAQPKLNQKNLNKIEIPLPSLAEQQRIVDILDRFDALCNDIKTGLPAEIEARKKQYEHYRDKLLTFKELS